MRSCCAMSLLVALLTATSTWADKPAPIKISAKKEGFLFEEGNQTPAGPPAVRQDGVRYP